MKLTDTKIDFWIENDINVMLKGKHGIGKTMRIKERFNANGLKWAYFSAATLDPWVDFIGIPKESIDENGVKFLDLIRPKIFATDQIEAIFIDEYNRAPSKIKNAIMELIQFKSINGKRFNNLRMIWAAINPDDDGYDVEPLDAAQLDRFHVIYELPYEPDAEYFTNKYGENGRISTVWWKNLDATIKNQISPRRLEYALDMFIAGGDIDDVFPEKANSHELIDQLDNGIYKELLDRLFTDKNKKESIKWLKKENFYVGTIDLILDNNEYIKFFIPLLTDEKVAILLTEYSSVATVLYQVADYKDYKDIVEPIILMSDGTDKKLKKPKITKKAKKANKAREILVQWRASTIRGDEINMDIINEIVNARDARAEEYIDCEINRTKVLRILSAKQYAVTNPEILAFLMELAIKCESDDNTETAITLIKDFGDGIIEKVYHTLDGFSQCTVSNSNKVLGELLKTNGIKY